MDAQGQKVMTIFITNNKPKLEISKKNSFFKLGLKFILYCNFLGMKGTYSLDNSILWHFHVSKLKKVPFFIVLTVKRIDKSHKKSRSSENIVLHFWPQLATTLTLSLCFVIHRWVGINWANLWKPEKISVFYSLFLPFLTNFGPKLVQKW